MITRNNTKWFVQNRVHVCSRKDNEKGKEEKQAWMEARVQKIKKERKETENEIRKEGRIKWELYISLVLSEQRTVF